MDEGPIQEGTGLNPKNHFGLIFLGVPALPTEKGETLSGEQEGLLYIGSTPKRVLIHSIHPVGVVGSYRLDDWLIHDPFPHNSHSPWEIHSFSLRPQKNSRPLVRAAFPFMRLFEDLANRLHRY